MRRWQLAVAGATTLLFAAACSDKTLTDPSRGIRPHGSSKTSVTGAGFTSVDETIDGTGHCKNGNPNNNCNIYDGKQYVWLNGGPVSGQVGDGTYFFAVLSPGGQADPNDGTTDNLSDDYDAYTNRTFTISGGAVSYSGTHVKDLPKINLMPYADTPNNGGVYILAICSLADGYPVAPSHCKYDAFKVLPPGTVVQASDLTVVKDAAGSYDNTYTWTIAKSVDKTTVQQVGGSVTFTYTVTVTHDGGTISNVKISGTISVFNPNTDGDGNPVPVNIDGVTDQLSGAVTQACTVVNGGAQTLTDFETDFTYSCSLSGLPQGEVDNTATVTWPDQDLTNGTALTGSSAHFEFDGISFTANPIDETVSVTDTYGGTLGTVTVGDANPKSFTYQRTIAVGAGCTSYDNTATFTTNDTGTTGSASQTVTVCGPTQTGALTMGFWKGPNGNSLIQNYCQSGALGTYLKNLGGGSGPFSNAATTCSGLVTYVNSILNGANATNMNSMLKAQMLATALDVWFSGPGWSNTASGKIKAPSSFLSHNSLGGFKMDVTAVCPMVDNLSTGSATCQGNKPSTDAVLAGAVPSSPMAMQAILDYAATVPPFNGSTSNSIWYAGDRTKEEILKNIFDQFNNGLAFGSF